MGRGFDVETDGVSRVTRVSLTGSSTRSISLKPAFSRTALRTPAVSRPLECSLGSIGEHKSPTTPNSVTLTNAPAIAILTALRAARVPSWMPVATRHTQRIVFSVWLPLLSELAAT
jgi:hypothetical protein